jgi:putative DNA primase/helicase
MLYTIVNVDYDPMASDDLVREVVFSAMVDDQEMADYIKKLLGYGCTGEVSEEIFSVWTGSGRNAKGVLVKAVQSVMGDKFFKVLNNGIIVDKNVSNPDAERGNLFGARFAIFNELREGDKLKTNEVQLLSGGDSIPATPKYKDPMMVQPRMLCILTTNHMPEISPVIPAIIERLQCIHFPVTFADLAPGEEYLCSAGRETTISR